MEDFKFYEVGGKIRDELLGLTNKDVDYVAVPTEAVTKRFTIEQTTWQAMVLYDYDSKMPVVSEERIREELIKCFRCNTIRTLTYLDYLPRLRDYIFSKTNLWLKPTNEK